MTRLRAAFRGNLQQYMREEYRTIEDAVTISIRSAGEGLKGELRAQVTGAGLGRRLANAWRLKVYPEKGQSAGAAAEVVTRAPQIIRAHEEGAEIRSRSGLFIAVPTEDAPPKGVGGKRISPSNFPEFRYGPLRFVYRKNGPSMLVVDGVRRSAKTGRISRQARNAGRLKNGQFAKGIQTVPMFWLVPRVRLRKKFDVGRAGKNWRDRVPSLLDRAFEELDRKKGRT